MILESVLSVYALVVKNFHTKKRQPVTSLCEILLPLFFVCGFTGLKFLFKSTIIPEGWIDSSDNNQLSPYGNFQEPQDLSSPIENDKSSLFYPDQNGATLCSLMLKLSNSTYASSRSGCDPVLSETGTIGLAAQDPNDLPKLKQMKDFINSQWCSSFSKYITLYNSSAEMENYLTDNSYGRDGRPLHPACIVFHKIYNTGESGDWDYSIRMNASIFADATCGVPVLPSTQLSNVDRLQNSMLLTYFDDYKIFMALQTSIDRYIIHQRNNMTNQGGNCRTTLEPNDMSANCELEYVPQYASVLPMPIRSYKEQTFYTSVISLLALLYILSFLFPLFKILASMVEEKELKIKEGLSIMSVGESSIATAWYVTYVFVYIFITLPVIIICKNGFFTPSLTGVFEASSPVVIFLLFYFFEMTILSYCYMLSAFFSKSKVAGVVGVIIFFALFFGYFGTANASESTKNGLCILSPIAFALAIESAGRFEGAGLGVTFQNMGTRYNDFAFSTAFGLLIFDIFLYTFVGWYLHRVLPREWGVVLPWYFPFTKSYWCGPKRRNPKRSQAPGETPSPYIEIVSDDFLALKEQNRCIDIIGLIKEFETPGGTKVAVNNLNVTMYEGQIFALLGHNGAGKTTTINMLCGMLPITGGRATILGYDVSTQMSAIRKNMGVCPQHNVLYNDLTVREHLELFGKIKGLVGERLESEVRAKVEDVGLTEKMDVLSASLSGGMKRKLSLAIAFIGDSKVVFLDEPTSGMDPYSRRFTWEVIRKNRAGRIIVLTTHFMDEADLLGDRIGIMGDGALRCCGSSLFLKSRYGQGYNLTITKTKNCDQDALKKNIEKSIEGSRILSDVGTELTFQLPLEQVSKFPELLGRFDDEGATLGVQNYGISITTMEEIFIRVAREGEGHAEIAKAKADVQHKKTANQAEARSAIRESSFLTQFGAVFMKRALCAKRDTRAVGCSLVFPLVLVLVGLCVIKYTGQSANESSLTLDVKQFDSDPNPFPYMTASPFSEPVASFVSQAPNTRGINVPFARSTASGKVYGVFYDDGVPCPKPRVGAQSQCNVSNYDVPNMGNSLYNMMPSIATRALDGSTDTTGAAALLVMGKYLSVGWSSEPYYGAGVLLNAAPSLATYVAYANTTAVHGAPTFLNFMDSVLAKGLRNSTIKARTHPYPTTATENSFNSSIQSFNATIFIMIAIAFIPAAFVSFIVREREDTHNAKHLQMLSGCGIISYWFANWMWDLTNYLPFFAGVMIMIKAFDVAPLVQDGGIGAVALLFIGFGFAVGPFTYVVSFAFRSASSAQNWTVLFFFLTGLILTLVAFFLSLDGIASNHVRNVNTSMKYVYRLFPGFCVGDGLYALAVANIAKTFTGEAHINPWKWSICGADIAFLFFDVIIYFSFTLIIDAINSYPAIRSLFFHDPAVPEKPFEEDPDVAAEANRVATLDPNDSVRVLGLRKCYPPAKVAVHKLQFGIGKGECFGLLGINGAGKTTTMKILTGDVLASEGNAQLNGFDVMKQLREVRKVVGYCPQFDGLTDLLSVREHLVLYAKLRGIPSSEIEGVVKDKLQHLDLSEFELRLAGTLSGGNKRKLSVAIATIGNPPVIFLDEPSTGMDPVARRFMWDVIAQVSTSSRESTVILTTHSMEECEALCSQVAIMVGGRFRCLGNVQHLKSRFGQGFTVDMKLKSSTGKENMAQASAESEQRVLNFFAENFPGYKVTERNPDHLVVKIDQTSMSVSKVFKAIESHKEALHVLEYSVSQTTLEQIFNYFAAQQEEEQARAPGIRGAPAIAAPPGAAVEMLPVTSS